MHRLLQRQLKRYVGSVDSVLEACPEHSRGKWKSFVDAVNEAYHQADTDRILLERSLDLTSQELLGRNQQIRQQMMTERERARLAEEQGMALLDVLQSVATGDLDVAVEVPEGIEVLSELAVGVEMMIDDLRGMMAEQERARAEIEDARQLLEAALEEVLDVQRRYLRQEWTGYTSATEASRGYFFSENAEGPTAEAWLPAMTTAVQQVDTVTELVLSPVEGSDEQQGQTLAVPISVSGQVIGVLGFSRAGQDAALPYSDDEITVVEAIVEQVGLALENQRLFDEEQRARSLLRARLKELDCLNDIGRKINESPPLPEFLQWVAERIPPALQYPGLCLVAIEFEGQEYGMAEAVSLPCQIVETLRVGGQVVGRIFVAYTQEHDFLDEESALLGDITRRMSGYIENRRLLQETQASAEELAVLNEMARTLTAMLDMETVIENIYHHTSRLLDTTNFYVALYDAEQDEVSFPLYAEGEQIRRAGRRRVGKGLTECVIRTREPVLVKENLDQWLEEQGIEPIGQEAQSWLGVPMMIGEQVIGVIAVQSYTTPRLYDEHHRDLLSAIASQAAIALENARLFQQTQASLEQVQAVHQRYLRESWQDYLDARGSAAQPAYLYDQAQIKPLPALQLSEIDRALAQKELILADGEEGGQTIAVPISLRGQPIGALAVEPPPGGRPWNEEEIALVESVATQLALAIENARLFEQTLRRAHRERLVREITDKIRGQTGLDAILQTTVVELGKVLGTSQAAIRLGTETELVSPLAVSR